MKFKRAILAALVAALLAAPNALAAAEPIVLFGSLNDGTNIVEEVVFPWGCAEAPADTFFATCFSGNAGGFETAYLRTGAAVLVVGQSTRFEAVTTGGTGPFLYVYDVYYQPFGKETRSYCGELHEVSTNSFLDFTPRREGRYILICSVSDSVGNSVKFDSDAIPTDKDGAISEVLEEVAKAALECGTEYEAVEYIHDWLMDNAEYSGTQSGQYEADSVLLYGRGVCSGYSSAFNMLCAACGIESFSVHGYATAQPISGKEHAWNCVNVGGDWYFTDVTRDDNDKAYERGTFFLMTSATCEQTHCFGASAGSFGAGGACLPPRCNATTYAEGYDDDPLFTDVRITVSGVDEVGEAGIVLNTGDAVQLYGTTTPRASRHPSKVWASSNEAVATVTNKGVLTAEGAGRCVVTLICGEYTIKLNVEVKEGK